MKKQITAACLAALCAAGCEESKPSKPTPPPVSMQAPAPPKLAVAPLVDAGALTGGEPAVPTDPIGLAHEHTGKVDHLARAQELQSQGDPDGALVEARRAAFEAPEDEETIALVAGLAKVRRQREVAAAAYERLGRLRSDDAEPMIQRARILVAMNRLDEAISAAEEALRRDGQSAEGHQAIGRAFLSKGELSMAIAHFKQAVEIDPDHGFALNNLGFAYLRANENQKAVEVLTRAAERLPSVAYVHNNLGVALERTGQVEEAKLAYATSTSLSPKYVKARVNSDRVAKAVLQAPTAPTEEEQPPAEPLLPPVGE